MATGSKPYLMRVPEDHVNRFIHPFRMGIVGQTMAGKSQLIKEILRYRRQLFTTEYPSIYFCMSEARNNSGFEQYIREVKSICPDVQIIEGLPTLDLLRSSELPKLFILDDLMEALFTNNNTVELFTRDSHHYSNSIVFTSQNYFSSKRDLTIMRNLSYRIIFFKSGELTYMSSISRQFSRDPAFLEKVFAMLRTEDTPREIDKKFVLIDSHPQDPLPIFPVRAIILPREDGEIRPLHFRP